MNFDVIDFSNKAMWNEIVKNGEVYYQWQYVDAFFKNGDGIPKLAFAELNGEYIYNVFLVRDIAKDLNLDEEKYNCFDIITPYGYGGTYTKSNNKDLVIYFFRSFEQYCQQNKIIAEFIRFNPLLNNYELYNNDEYKLENISKTVYIKLDDPEQIWNDMEGRCRTSIRKAQKNNLVIKSGFDRETLEEFINIYQETMKRDSADEYYFFNDDFFESILNNLKSFAKIYTVYYNGKAINSSIIMFNGKNAHYHLSGTLSEYMKLGANNYALYEIALDLCKMGYEKFHLGGGYGGDNSPLFKFKMSFNKFGELDFYIGKKIWNNEIYLKLCKELNIDQETNFFPAYRRGE